ncbi:alpha/beta hydrolase family esterase [Adhaeretor mobilis]|uniref:Oxidized polyvinyl alcohol hydrolase n=1 Tax=Adhaeretor mobilis TaxID=1930276 RepID=A0A517N131_9BACT|nr:PHB depolymerase family esterase [Adhaeretor mobilis]QDT00836.1 Oxidized polyvinyl alcohol hydrolase precursor [Adhaeretor mobilis]
MTIPARKRSYFALALIGATLIATVSIAQRRARRAQPTGKSVAITHDDREREFRIHVPASCSEQQPVPLVLCLHGGGGNSSQGSTMGMTDVADRHGFIAVYPNAINHHWNDGRESPNFAEHDKTIDDVAFLTAIVRQVREDYAIDANRVFATGVSNGGFMTQRLAIERPEIFSAAGVIIASMGVPLKEKFKPELPVSILYMNGTADPLVPYDGGPIRVDFFPRLRKARGEKLPDRGSCIPTDEAVALWIKRNGITAKPKVGELADKNPDDECTTEFSLWTGGERGTTVALYKVVGGGHTIPGAKRNFPKSLVGPTSGDFDGFETVWKFFNEHARLPENVSAE